MKKTNTIALALSAVLLFSCGKGESPAVSFETTKGNVVGGEKVAAGELVNVVGLRNGDGVCSGNLTSSTTIYTAAHCLQPNQVDAAGLTKFQNEVLTLMKELFGEEATEAPTLEMLRETVEVFMQKKAKALGFYFGQGTPGERFTGNQLAVSEVIIKPSYINALVDLLLGKKPEGFSPELQRKVENLQARAKNATTPAEAEAIKAEAEELEKEMLVEQKAIIAKTVTRDIAIIKLSEPVEGITPVGIASAAEMRDLSTGDLVVASGFGIKVDMRIVQKYGSDLETLNLLLLLERDPQKRAEIERARNQVAEQFGASFELYKQSGDKNKITLKIDNIASNGVMTLKGLSTTELQGVCSGDSGGPVFAKTRSGELKQVGVNVAVNLCGVESYIVPVR